MLTLSIESLGAQGDGLAHIDGRTVFVPFALPGESVDVRLPAHHSGERAELLSVIASSPERQPAPCPHFGRCGGCDLQHANETVYRAFKRGLVVDALCAQGFDAAIVHDLVPCLPATRRRAVLSAIRQEGRICLGFFEGGTHRIAPIEVCLVVVPEIASRLADFAGLAAIVADRKRAMRIAVTATNAGLDIALSDTAKLTEALRRQVVSYALKRDFARVSLGDDVLMESRKPSVDIAGIAVALPPGAFLQAVAGAEDAMGDLAGAHLHKAKAIADLFCGIGTFALRLAAHSAVHGVEHEASALHALDLARRGTSGLKPLTTERRDLVRRPVTARELGKFDGVVFDPPRAGAQAQAQEIAGSTKTRLVAAVSCNPTTLARDLGILVAGGFKLSRVVPIDQFLWSHHVEAVALLER